MDATPFTLPVRYATVAALRRRAGAWAQLDGWPGRYILGDLIGGRVFITREARATLPPLYSVHLIHLNHDGNGLAQVVIGAPSAFRSFHDATTAGRRLAALHDMIPVRLEPADPARLARLVGIPTRPADSQYGATR